MMGVLVKNYIYTFVYQIFSIAIPIITAPYLARVLGAEGVGTYSFYHSIACYFAMFIALGVSNYGNRSIAQCMGNKEKISKVFSEIIMMQVLCGIIVSIFYFLYARFVSNAFYIYLLYFPFLLSSMLDVTWYFFGRENFRVIVVRNFVVKTMTTALIFLLVKTERDLNAYILILSCGGFVSQFIVWPRVLKETSLSLPKIGNVLHRLKPNLILFIPFVAVSVYRTMDKIMIGTLTSNLQVGYYENAEKLISLLLTFITSIGTVMLPRMSALYAGNDSAAIRSMLMKTTVVMTFMASAVAFGITAISENLVIWFYGIDFVGSIPILKILCVTIPFICYANILRMQILIPSGNDKIYVISTIIGACVNLLLNVVLIPLYGGVGAAVGTVAAEFTVFLFQFMNLRKKIEMNDIVPSVLMLWVNGVIMFALVVVLSSLLPSGFVGLICQIFVGMIIYFVFILFQSKFVGDKYIRMLVSVVKQMFQKLTV